MVARRRARTGARGGEPIPPLHPARRPRIALAAAAVLLAIALGALVATDAGGWATAASTLAVVAAISILLAVAAGSESAVQVSIALLALLILMRHGDRLALAPVYAGGLLIVSELAQQAIELRGVRSVAAWVVGARVARALAVAAFGAAVGAAATLAVRVAPGRSVAFTALGAAALLMALGAITWLARRQAR